MHISFSDFRSYLHYSGIREFSIGFISSLLMRLDFFFFSVTSQDVWTRGRLLLTPQSQTKVNGKVQPWSLLKHERRHRNVKFFCFLVNQYCSNSISPLSLCIIVFSASVTSLGNKKKQTTNYLSLNPFVHFAIGVEEALTSFRERANLLLLIQIPLGASKVQRQSDELKSSKKSYC